VAGAGRFFEGTASDMQHILRDGSVARLPDATLLFCGHEYTLDNLQFAHWLEPDNQPVKEKMQWAESMRAASPSAAADPSDALPRPTVPSTIGDEKATNPFWRSAVGAFPAAHDSSPSIYSAIRDKVLHSAAGKRLGLQPPTDAVGALHCIRELKNAKAHA
jgi:hypothetical protein